MREMILSIELLFLAVNAFWDLQKRQILMWSLPVFAACVLAVTLQDEVAPIVFASGMLPGALLLLLGRIAGGAIGIGDGLIVIALGALSGLEEVTIVLFLGFVASSIYCGVQFLLKKKTGSQEVAFVPFLLMGFVAAQLL